MPPPWCPHVRSQPPCCDFCFNQDIPLFEGGFDSTTRSAPSAQPEPSPRSAPSPSPSQPRLLSDPRRKPSRIDPRSQEPGRPPGPVRHRARHRQEAARPRRPTTSNGSSIAGIVTLRSDRRRPRLAQCVESRIQHPPHRSFRLGQDPPGQVPGSYLNVPLVIGDATSLTEAGYVGETWSPCCPG